jgi:hypothetical protein
MNYPLTVGKKSRRKQSRRQPSRQTRGLPTGASGAELRNHDWRSPNRLALIALFLAFMVATSLFALSRLLPAGPATVPISASVDHTGAVTMTFANAAGSATSPACGCIHNNPPGGWRGIVLPALNLTVSRRVGGVLAPTEYDISNAAPQQLNYLAERFGLKVSVGVIAVPEVDVGRDPESLGRAQLLGSFRDTELTDWLSIVVNGTLHVRSTSREPVAALSPPSWRPTVLNYLDVDPSRPSSEGLSLTTSFNPSAASQTRDLTKGSRLSV